ncbi:MAG: Gfo/Idh/MocA family oxidoreductase [bacterium]
MKNKKPKEDVRIAVIGAGYWGKNLVRSFYGVEGGRLAAVCDVAPGAFSSLKRLYRDVRYVRDYGEVISSGDVDAVVVATPAELHYRMAMDALRAGKHVLVEKPLSLKSGDCRRLIAEAEKRKLILMAGHTFLYNDAVNAVKGLIDSGELGEVYYIYAQRLNLGVVRRDVDVVWNLAPHDVSIICMWLGEVPGSVSARGRTYLQRGIHDVAFVDLYFGGEVFAHVHVSWLDPGKVRAITIVGSRKMAVYDDVSPDAKVRVYDKGISVRNLRERLGDYDDFGKFQLITRAGDLVVPKIDFREPLQVESAHFVECVREGRRPLTDGRNGLDVVRVLEAAQRSLQTGGKRAPVR